MIKRGLSNEQIHIQTNIGTRNMEIIGLDLVAKYVLLEYLANKHNVLLEYLANKHNKQY